MFGNSNLQLPPQIFYGIKVWRLSRPLQDLHDAIFDYVALVSWMRLWLQLFIHIQICIQADVLICWINKTFQVSHL